MTRKLATLALGVLLSLAVATGCGQSDKGAAKQAAVSYFKAVQKNDKSAACKVATGACKDFAGLTPADIQSPEATNVAVIGGTALVQITVSNGASFTVPLTKKGDEWKVEPGNIKGGSGDLFDRSIRVAKQRTVQNPNSDRAWLGLARAELNLAKSPEAASGVTGKLTHKGQQAAMAGVNAWEHYLKLGPSKPSAAVARLAAPAYAYIGDFSGAFKAQKIVVEAGPPVAWEWSELSLYAYANGDNQAGDAAQKKALALTPADRRDAARSKLKQAEKVGKQFAKAGGGALTTSSGQ